MNGAKVISAGAGADYRPLPSTGMCNSLDDIHL